MTAPEKVEAIRADGAVKADPDGKISA